VNVLSKVPGTPMAGEPDVPVWDTVRMIAAARILMPASVVRLSAGRAKLSESDQALCFMAGANSIFSSETKQMLTKAVPSPDYDADRELLTTLGLRPRAAYKDGMRSGMAQNASETPQGSTPTAPDGLHSDNGMGLGATVAVPCTTGSCCGGS
jgi:biotin synthase-like enzyme